MSLAPVSCRSSRGACSLLKGLDIGEFVAECVNPVEVEQRGREKKGKGGKKAKNQAVETQPGGAS